MDIVLYFSTCNVKGDQFKDTLTCVSNRSQEYWL